MMAPVRSKSCGVTLAPEGLEQDVRAMVAELPRRIVVVLRSRSALKLEASLKESAARDPETLGHELRPSFPACNRIHKLYW